MLPLTLQFVQKFREWVENPQIKGSLISKNQRFRRAKCCHMKIGVKKCSEHQKKSVGSILNCPSLSYWLHHLLWATDYHLMMKMTFSFAISKWTDLCKKWGNLQKKELRGIWKERSRVYVSQSWQKSSEQMERRRHKHEKSLAKICQKDPERSDSKIAEKMYRASKTTRMNSKQWNSEFPGSWSINLGKRCWNRAKIEYPWIARK